jgi:hypothetical protein
MNAAALVCPHCGKRRPDAEVGLAGKGLSKEEVNALIAVHGKDDAPSQGVVQTVIFPHPTTHGTARTVELACTLIALPMVILGAFSLVLSRRRTRRSADQTSGELVPVLAMSGLGGLGLYSALSLAGVGLSSSLAVIGVSIAALITRGAIRSHASTKRSRDLHRLAKPEREPTPPAPAKAQLPEARVASSRSSAPVIAIAPPTRPTEAPRAEVEAPDEPSLLK